MLQYKQETLNTQKYKYRVTSCETKLTNLDYVDRKECMMRLSIQIIYCNIFYVLAPSLKHS